MKTLLTAAMLAGSLLLAACSDSGTDSQTTGSTEVDTNPDVRHDTSPETGTGGDQQGSTPAEPAKPAN